MRKWIMFEKSLAMPRLHEPANTRPRMNCWPLAMSSYSNRRANFLEAGRQLTAQLLSDVKKYQGERVRGVLPHAPKASLLAKPLSAAEVLLLLHAFQTYAATQQVHFLFNLSEELFPGSTDVQPTQFTTRPVVQFSFLPTTYIHTNEK